MSGKVVITGVNGFAGGYLAPLLASAGFHVVGLTHGRSATLPNGVAEVHEVDLCDLKRLQQVISAVQPTHVVHLAAISFVAYQDVGELYQTNIVGTKNLLLALDGLTERPKSILLASSANVYGNTTPATSNSLREVDLVEPTNDYAISKLAMEYVARQFRDRLNIVVARPFNYTGIGQSENFIVPKIVKHFREGAACIELGNIEVARDFSDVRSTVSYFQRLLLSPRAIGEIFNICSGQAYSLKYIISVCERLTGRNLEIRVNPSFIRPNELNYLTGNPEKLHDEVGLVGNYPFEQTLEWMLAG